MKKILIATICSTIIFLSGSANAQQCNTCPAKDGVTALQQQPAIFRLPTIGSHSRGTIYLTEPPTTGFGQRFASGFIYTVSADGKIQKTDLVVWIINVSPGRPWQEYFEQSRDGKPVTYPKPVPGAIEVKLLGYQQDGTPVVEYLVTL